MRFAHLRRPDSSRAVLAVVEGSDAILVSDLLSDAPATLQQLIERGDAGLDELRAALRDGTAPRHPLTGWGFASAVIALARSLNLCTVAEGVETPEQADELGRLGASYLQGFSLAEPMTGGHAAAWFAVHGETAS